MLVYALGITLILGGLWILAIATGWGLPYSVLVEGLNWFRTYPWESVVVAGFLLLVGLLLLMRPRESKNREFRISSKGGAILISQEALQEIILRSATALPGVIKVQSSLRELEVGLEITIYCQFEQGVLIPQTSGELQTKVKQDVELYTGMTVTEVKVLVRRLEKLRPARVQ